jgi:hypothetical protein
MIIYPVANVKFGIIAVYARPFGPATSQAKNLV